jgi:hypothetical protein
MQVQGVNDGDISEEPNIRVLKSEILQRYRLCDALEQLLRIET